MQSVFTFSWTCWHAYLIMCVCVIARLVIGRSIPHRWPYCGLWLPLSPQRGAFRGNLICFTSVPSISEYCKMPVRLSPCTHTLKLLHASLCSPPAGRQWMKEWWDWTKTVKLSNQNNKLEDTKTLRRAEVNRQWVITIQVKVIRSIVQMKMLISTA